MRIFVFGDIVVTVRGAVVRREIEDEHAGSFHKGVGSDTDVRFPVAYLEEAEERLVGYCTRPFKTRVQRYNFGEYLPPIHVHHEVVETEIPKILRVSVRRSREIDFTEKLEK